MNKEKEIKFGNDVHKEKEATILVQRNTVARHMSNPNGYLSFNGGISLDLWNNVNLDWINIRNIIMRYFINFFDWECDDKELVKMMEKILFRYGRCALVKLPNGKIYPTQYSYQTEDLDYYANPTKITMLTSQTGKNNPFNGKIIYEGNFVIIYNNFHKLGTLYTSLIRLQQTIRALVDVDNNSKLTRPKWAIGKKASDKALADIENAINSESALVNVADVDFKDVDMNIITQEDRSVVKQDNYKFQLDNMLKGLGLITNDSQKAERMSELEVSKGDVFSSHKTHNLLIYDMWKERNDKVEAMNNLGLKISLKELELQEQTDNNNELNGELNKNKRDGGVL